MNKVALCLLIGLCALGVAGLTAGVVRAGQLPVAASGVLTAANQAAVSACWSGASWEAGATAWDPFDSRLEYTEVTVTITEASTDGCDGAEASVAIYTVSDGAPLAQSASPVTVSDQGGDTTAIVQIGLSDGVPDGNDQNDAGTGLALLVQ